MLPVNVLQAAKGLISNSKDWIKGDFMVGGKYCAMGAIYAIEDVNETETCADKFLRDALEIRLGMGNRMVAAYNDAPERTHEEIMSLYDQAIVLAQKELA
jgi:hypothetical protein